MLKSFVYQDFRGMNRLSDRLNMSPEFAWMISNGYIKKDVKTGLGTIKQRAGIAKFNTVDFTNACKYIYEAKWNAGGTDVIIREGTRWAKYDGTDSFDDLDTGRIDGNRGQTVMFGNELIMVDGGTPRKCTSAYAVANLSSDASMPTDASAIHVHQHKVWLNSAANPMKAYYSKTDSANASDSWSATSDAGNLDFSKILPFGDTLIGFATFSSVFLCFVFKKHIIIYTCGTDPTGFTLQQIIPLNCVSTHGIQVVGNDLAICSLEGINGFRSSLTNQDLDVDDLSKYIAPYYRDTIAGLTNKMLISVAFSHKLNHLYIGLPLTSGHKILVYSLDVKNIVGVWSGYNCHSFCERIDGTMLVGGNGYVYTMNSGTNDDGTAISFQYSFPFLYFKDANRNKALRQLEGIISHEASSSSFSLYFDYWYGTGTEVSDAKTSSLSLDADIALYRVALYRVGLYRASGQTRFLNSNLLGRGKQVAIDLYHSVLDASVEIPYLIARVKFEGEKIR
jgi:hypothetical protein